MFLDENDFFSEFGCIPENAPENILQCCAKDKAEGYLQYCAKDKAEGADDETCVFGK